MNDFLSHRQATAPPAPGAQASRLPWGRGRLARAATTLCLATLLSATTYALPQQSPAAGAGKSPGAYLGQALRDYQTGKLEAAIDLLKQAQKAYPDYPPIRLQLGLFLYLKNNDDLEAQHLMESVLDDFPEHSDLQLKLLDSYLRHHDSAKVDSLLKRIQPRMEQESRFAFDVIYTLIYYGQFQPAQAETNQASERLQGEILFISGLIAAGQNKAEDTVRLFGMAEKHGFPPSGSPQMLMLAENAFRFGDYRQAARGYKDYLEHAAKPSPLYRFRLGLCDYSGGDLQAAEQEFRQVLKEAPNTPEVNYYLGTVLIDLKRAPEAVPFLEAQLKADPSSFKSMTKLAYVHYLQGQDDQCKQLLDRSMALNSEWFETHLVYGLLYSRLGQYAEAVKSLETSLKYEPSYPKTYYQLSLACRRTGDEAKARQYMETYQKLTQEQTDRALKFRGLQDRQ